MNGGRYHMTLRSQNKTIPYQVKRDDISNYRDTNPITVHSKYHTDSYSSIRNKSSPLSTKAYEMLNMRSERTTMRSPVNVDGERYNTQIIRNDSPDQHSRQDLPNYDSGRYDQIDDEILFPYKNDASETISYSNR